MGPESENHRQTDFPGKAPSPSDGLSMPEETWVAQLQSLSRSDQIRLLANLTRINSEIETFGETIARVVLCPLVAAVETSPSTASHTSGSITQAITDITATVFELDNTITWFIRQGNEPLRAYRELIEDGTQLAIRLLKAAHPSTHDEAWRIKIHSAILLLRQTISDDCEAITPNLLLLIRELQRILGEDEKDQAARA